MARSGAVFVSFGENQSWWRISIQLSPLQCFSAGPQVLKCGKEHCESRYETHPEKG